MLKNFIRFLRSYARGDAINVEVDVEVPWWKVIAILVIIGLIIYIICKL